MNPSHTGDQSVAKDTDHDQHMDSSNNIISIAQNQERLNKEIKHLEKEKGSTGNEYNNTIHKCVLHKYVW